MNGPLSRLIGICGKARHGKGEVAAMLVNLGFLEVQFSAPVKQLMANIDPLIEHEPGSYAKLGDILFEEGWEGAKQFAEVRRLLQGLGNGAREIVHPDTWVNGFRYRFGEMIANGTKMVVSDMRYPNEANVIHELGGEVWKIERGRWTTDDDPDEGPGVWVPFDNGLGELQQNASETSVDLIDPDLTIFNDGALSDLRLKLKQYLVRRALT